MSNANFMELPPKSLARVHRRWFSGTVCFIEPLAFGVVPPFFSALTQDEEEVMGAAFRPSYWAQTLAKDAKGWVEGVLSSQKSCAYLSINICIYIYNYLYFWLVQLLQHLLMKFSWFPKMLYTVHQNAWFSRDLHLESYQALYQEAPFLLDAPAMKGKNTTLSVYEDG